MCTYIHLESSNDSLARRGICQILQELPDFVVGIPLKRLVKLAAEVVGLQVGADAKEIEKRGRRPRSTTFRCTYSPLFLPHPAK